MSNEVNTGKQSLRYLDADAVECPAGKLDGLRLVARDEPLGSIDGVLIDPSTRKLRYYVVGRARLFKKQRYLVSADMPAVVLPDQKALHVELSVDEIERQQFDSDSVEDFSDDDLLKAMFSKPAA
jgi:hypothetical protein